MITAHAWAGKRYGVLGLARSGAATVAALLASGARVAAWDRDEARRAAILPHKGEGDHEVVEGEDSQAFAGPAPPSVCAGHLPLAGEDLVIADLDTIDLSTLDALVLSPGIPLNTHPLAAKARAAGVPIIGDIELFAQARPELPPHKVVGITGTNGKSTVTALIHHILQTAGVPSLMGGNIGLPILAQEPLHANEQGVGVYVLELSSYQLDLTQTLDCDVAVLTNITPDHLDRYEGFEAYAASKARLFEMQRTGMAIITDVEGMTRDILKSLASRPIEGWKYPATEIHSFGHARPESGRVWRPMVIPNEMPVGQEDWPNLQGPHNLQNAAAAIATCGILDVGANQIRAALYTFPGLPHRTEHVGEVAGVGYVNDSKATNPESAALALASFARVHWIVGGRAKGDDLDACRPAFPHVVRAYTIGEAGPRFAAVLAPDLPVTECGTLDVAVHAAAAAAKPGETVLLSPAAASFDQYRDFEHRGDAFRVLVEALAA